MNVLRRGPLGPDDLSVPEGRAFQQMKGESPTDTTQTITVILSCFNKDREREDRNSPLIRDFDNPVALILSGPQSLFSSSFQTLLLSIDEYNFFLCG